ncbi:MAG: O-antigen ligase family protein [Ignavibacteriales bacterium]|nr:O-antigen ligase family protein [Ignavibacteriales bacterium]
MVRTLPVRLQTFGLFLFAFSLPISFVPAEFGIVFAVLGWAVDGMLNRHWKFVAHPLFIPLSIYIAWNILSSLMSIHPLHSLWAVADNEWSVLIMFMLFWLVPDIRTLQRLVVVFCATSSLAMFYAVWQVFAGVELWRGIALDHFGDYYRAVGFVGFYLTFAAFAMSVLSLSGNLAVELKGRPRALSALVAVLSFLGIVVTFARSIWLGLLVMIPVAGFLRSRRLGTIVSAGFALIAASILVISPATRERAFSIADASQNETRLNLWATSLKMVQARPIIGIGEDNFYEYFPAYKVEGFYDTIVHPHNDYLNVAVSSGIPGLAAFVALWIVAIRTGFQAWKKARDPFLKGVSSGGAVAIIGFLLGSFFQNYYGTFANCLGWWFMTGLMMSAWRLSNE